MFMLVIVLLVTVVASSEALAQGLWPAPTGVSASDGTYPDKVRITWNSVSADSQYRVYRATSSTETPTPLSVNWQTGTSYDDTSAISGTTYYYWVKARVLFLTSDYSSYDTGWYELPGPTGVSASDGTYTNYVFITWISSYSLNEVYRATSLEGSRTLLSLQTDTIYVDTSATPGVTYWYWVKGKTSLGGVSGFSSSNTGWRKLSAPTEVSASDGTYTDRVYITWSSVSGASYYHVYRATSSGGPKTLLGSWQTGTSYNDTSATPGATYYYWVNAATSSSGSRASDYSPYDTGTVSETNQSPVANAGPDQTVFAWFDGIDEVTLDGSGSSDPDGDALTYLWTWAIDSETYEATGVSPTIELPIGEHFIELIVNDGTQDSGADEVIVEVFGPVPVDDLVNLTYGRMRFDRRTGLMSMDVVITNTSDRPIVSPIGLVIESISNPAVTLANSDGTTDDDKEYIDLTGLLGDGQLDPGESVSTRIYFNNPSRVRFTFESSVRGMILP